MNKIRQIMTSALMSVMVLTLVPTMTAKAEEYSESTKTYTYTIRSGNVGQFDADNIQIDGAEVTANYIKVNVPRGESLNITGDQLVSFMDGEFEGYTDYVLLTNDATEALKSAVTRNTEYVLDYGVLKNAVRYTVYYLDVDSNEQVFRPTLAGGEDGEVITVSPATFTNYTAVSNEPVTFTLSEGADNSVTFYYRYTGPTGANRTETTYITLPGGATTTYVNGQVVYVPVPGAADAGNAGGGQAAAAAGGAVAGGGQAEDAVVIADEEVPLAGNGETEDEGDGVTISDEEVPLSIGDELNMPLIIGCVIAALIAAALVAFALRKRKPAEEGSKNKKSE